MRDIQFTFLKQMVEIQQGGNMQTGMAILQLIEQDKFFEKTSIEYDDLYDSIKALKLEENDVEYHKIEKSYADKVK